MSDYAATLSKHRRLIILRFLKEAPAYTSNASILETVCNDFGVTSTRDQVVGELQWLKENGFVSSEKPENFVTATVTKRGIEIATGLARHDGIQRPQPGT